MASADINMGKLCLDCSSHRLTRRFLSGNPDMVYLPVFPRRSQYILGHMKLDQIQYIVRMSWACRCGMSSFNLVQKLHPKNHLDSSKDWTLVFWQGS